MFKPVSPRLNITLLEEGVLRYWQIHNIFEKSMKDREGNPEFVFYEGPPTANGIPGSHHVLARVFKDIFPRYKTMQGFHVSRRGGWDTHGLPVEIEVEKKLGFNNKQQIENYGIDKFNTLCRESAFSYIQEWERLTSRIGYWVDLQNAYVTFTNEYIESVWWILKNFWEKKLLYQGFKVVPYCPRCGTPLSDHEVAQGYAEATDPSIFVRMPLVEQPSTALLVWTTTPWTLPANVAVAANPNLEYALVERELPEGGSEKLILAHSLLKNVFGEERVKVQEKFKGKHLKGKRYKPLFTFLPVEKQAHFVVLGDFVTAEDGTGLVHMAPAFGQDDMQMAKEQDLPILMTVQPDGGFIKEVRPWAGRFVKDADPLITKDLQERGLLFRETTFQHTYPFCWRCDTPLLYYARPTWYVATSKFKDRLVTLNQTINWVPEHIKTGRFGNWLENNVDWALGRERFWGTPLPVWECRECKHQICIGSIAELEKLAGKDFSKLDLHRPYVDQIKFSCPKCKKGVMARVLELIDCWFDSGSMPIAQWHYPFENEENFKKQFPADYICEAVDQTRGWFYSLHAISTLLMNQVCYKNVICLGLILDKDGKKMSKHLGNMADPWKALNSNGADALRWYLYTASPPSQERRWSEDLIAEVVRTFTLTLWNTYSFFITYARLDHWKPDSEEVEYSPLDKWLRSSLHAMIHNITEAMESYDVLGATRPIEVFVDHLSNWYLRRSRRRFWKSGSDSDKKAAYATLYEALVTLSKMLAPTMPFMAEELYQNLVRTIDSNTPISVHLAQWPTCEEIVIDAGLNKDMELVMKLASLGHAARNKANRKVRQPLAEAAFSVGIKEEASIVEKYSDLLEDELNVKKIRILNAAGEAMSFKLNPYPKQLGQKYGNKFPALREAILKLDPEKSGLQLLEGKSLPIKTTHGSFEILPGEVEICIQAKEGFAVAAEGAYVAALVTQLTPELEMEGLAREFIRRVQEFRKESELDIADRILVTYTASEKLSKAVEDHKEFIMAEILAIKMEKGKVAGGKMSLKDEFDGENVAVELIRVRK
jgi:isoleucyl-tRNA synthetase